MAVRRISSTAEALELLFEEVRQLKARISQPRTRLLVGQWEIREDADGNLIMRHNQTGTTHTFSA